MPLLARAVPTLAATLIASTALAQQERLEVLFDLQPYTHLGSWSFSQGCTSSLHPTARTNFVHLTVVWLEDMNGNYVTTLHRWGRTYAYDLRAWAAVSGAGIDGVTTATPTSDGTLGVAAQQATVFTTFTTGPQNVSWIPDGTYRVRLETTQCELADVFRTPPSPNPYAGGTAFGPTASFTFTKGRAAQTAAVLGSTAPFNNVRVNYTVPAGAPPAVWAGTDQWLMPSTNPTQSSTMLTGRIATANPPSVMWSVVSTKPGGLTPMIATPAAATTSVTFTQAGVYVFRLTATAGSLTSTDDVVVYVNAHVLDAGADAEVGTGYATVNHGTLNNGNPWAWAAANAARSYFRFDLTGISGRVTYAQLQLRPVEMSADPADIHDFFLLTDPQDDWNGMANSSTDYEGTITWNNQPVAAGGVPPANQLLASMNHWSCAHRHAFANPSLDAGQPASVCPGRIDLDLNLAPVTMHDTNKIWSVYMVPRQMTANGLGLAQRENGISNQLLVVEFWQAGTNQAPVANAGPARTVTDATPPLGQEPVTLDGSGSTDDVGIVSYEWKEGSTVLGTPTTPTFTTPLALGPHSIDLKVTDGANLTATASTTITVDDRFTPNQARAMAPTITGSSAGTAYDNLYTGGTGMGGDWYAIDLVAGSTLNVSVTMARGNLDVALFDANGTQITNAATTGLTETVMTTASMAGRRFIQVVAANATSGSTYSMNVTASGSLSVVFNPTSAVENQGTLTGIGTVRLDAASSMPVTVMLTSGAPAQLTFPMAAVTIPQGQLSAPFDVRLVDDPPGIPNTSRFVTVTASANGLNPGSAQFEIQDNEASVFVSWDRATETVSEGAASSLQLRAQLSGTTTGPVTVPFTITGTATRGTDFTTPIMTGQLTISSGTSATYLINVVNDSMAEGDETVIVTMGTPTGASASGATVYTLTITDDDSGSTGGGTAMGGGTAGSGGATGGGSGGGGAEPGVGGCNCSSFPLLLPWLALGVFRRRARRT